MTPAPAALAVPKKPLAVRRTRTGVQLILLAGVITTDTDSLVEMLEERKAAATPGTPLFHCLSLLLDSARAKQDEETAEGPLVEGVDYPAPCCEAYGGTCPRCERAEINEGRAQQAYERSHGVGL